MGISLLILFVVSVLVGFALREKTEEVFPCVLLSVIGILYPFYCMDMLKTGRYAVYGLLAAAAVSSAFVLIRKRPAEDSVRKALSPGIWLFAGLCAFYVFYTGGHLVGLWDELRLWGAVPKALYFTESLQLGTDALIFRNMQQYPPGMPLLVYFMTALSPRFCEGHIFAVYAVFFSAMLLPSLRNLRWTHWKFFLPLVLMIICAPCLFTSHGGDGGWFYGSLFIDPILGALAGYVFYLSFMHPFDTWFSVYRFAAALLVMTIIKDSGAMFALMAAGNAAVLFLTEKDHRISRKVGAIRMMLAFLSICIGYGMWKLILPSYGIVSNEQGFLKKLPTLGGVLALCRKLRSMAMVSIQDPLFINKLTLTYVPCFLILAGTSFRIEKRNEKHFAFFVTWAAMVAAIGVFSLGYIMSFGTSLPSFQRYMSTTLVMLLVFVFHQGVPRLTEWLSTVQIVPSRRIPVALMSLVMVSSAVLFVAQWQNKKADLQNTIAPANAAAVALEMADGSVEDPANIYLLISEDPRGNSKLHHRIYYELLGTNACVRNFWNDVNIVGGETIPETWTPEEIADIAEKWAEKLVSKDYDYVYVVAVNDFSAQVLKELGVDQVRSGDLFRIQNTSSGVRLVMD